MSIKNHLYPLILICVGLSVFMSFFNVGLASSNANNSKMLSALNTYAKTNENADFKPAKLQKGRLVIMIDDDYVEPPVTSAGLSSYIEDTYKQVSKYQKKYKTHLNIIFKDKSNGTIAKSSYHGHGWYKDLEDSDPMKYNYNFRTGEDE